jgi:hypothetical protein
MASVAPPPLETFLPLLSLGALMTVVVGVGEEVAVSVTVGDVDGGALETVGEGCATTAGGCAVEAAGWGLAGAGVGDGWGAGAGTEGAGGVGVAGGALTVRTGAGSPELGGPIQRTISPVLYVWFTGIG